MLDFAPAEYRDRIWHVETDADGIEWFGVQRPAHAVRPASRARPGSPTRTSTGSATARSATPRPGRRGGRPSCAWPTWTPTASSFGAVPDVHARAPERDTTSSSARSRPGPTTTGARRIWRRARVACSAPARSRRCTTPTTCRRGRRAPARGRAARDGVGLHAAEPGDRVAHFNDAVYDPIWSAAAGHRAPRSPSTRSSRPTCPARARA